MLNFIDIPAPEGPYGPAKKMIIMHGRGDVKESFIPITREINVTGLSYRLLDAPSPFMFGYSWYAAAPADPIPDIKKSVALILENIQSLKMATKDIFIAGFSQGAALALEVALASQTAFAGVVCLSPRLFIRDELLNSKMISSVDCFMAHGQYDEMIPFEETSNGLLKLKEKGLSVEFHSYPMGHEIEIEEIRELRSWLNERL
tara:strand:+ start:20366 stop:20974 length:609 start_codon:yes stop_codon:yes gene_type:complete